MAEVIWAVSLGGQVFELELHSTAREGVWDLELSGTGAGSGRTPVSLRHVHGSKYLISLGNRTAPIFLNRCDEGYHTVLYGHDFTAAVEEARLFNLKQEMAARKGTDGPVEVTAPMPGLVLTVEVAVDDRVEEGDGLLVVESMKMENEVRSPSAGIVKAIAVEQGQTVDRGAVMMKIVPAEDS